MMRGFVQKLLTGTRAQQSSQRLESSYTWQIRCLKEVWGDRTYGLERVFRLFLCVVQFIYPIILIREISGRYGGTARKLSVEIYNLFKLFLPLFVLASGFYRFPVVIGVCLYLMSETIVHLLQLIFLSDVHDLAISYHRSMLLLFLHYVEVAADFAVVYIGLGLLNQQLSGLSALYFSLVASTTVGFGDIHAQGRMGQAVVIAQLLVCVLFVAVFINYFSQKESD